MEEKEPFINNFPEYLNHSQKVLNLNIEDIKKVFYGNWLCIQTYVEKGEKEIVVDIRLDNMTKLSCHFIKGELCDMSFLHPDKLVETHIYEYINYLNNIYDYDFLRGGWILPNCYIAIKELDGNYYFVFYKLF